MTSVTVVPAPAASRSCAELGQQERALRGGATVDDGRLDMRALEADDEVRPGERSRLEHSRAVRREVEPELSGDVQRRLERGRRWPVEDPERGDLGGRTDKEVGTDSLGEGAPKLVRRANEGDLERPGCNVLDRVQRRNGAYRRQTAFTLGLHHE